MERRPTENDLQFARRQGREGAAEAAREQLEQRFPGKFVIEVRRNGVLIKRRDPVKS